MRGWRIAAIVMVAAMSWHGAYAQSSAPPVAPPAQPQADLRPIAIGLGAIAGVVVFNVAALGIEALPGGLGYAAGATVPAEMSVAMSRVYATASAVVGGWIGYYSVSK